MVKTNKVSDKYLSSVLKTIEVVLINYVRVNLKSGSTEIVPRWRSNVPRWLKNFVRQITRKIVPRWDRNVTRWCAGCGKQKRIF